MPTVIYDKKDLLKLLGRKISDSTLKDRIAMLGTDLSGIEGDEITVEIFPNRPDMLTIEGFARALSLFMGFRKGLANYKIKPSDYRVKVEDSVRGVRPYIVCAVLTGIKVTDELIKSMMQMQEKLHQTHGRKRLKVAIGIHDLDKIHFPLFYRAVKPKEVSFIPLGTVRKMNLQEVIQKHPKGQEYEWILEGKEVYPVILDSNANVVSFPPIINSAMTEVNEKTQNIFIDVTGTDERAVMSALNIIVTSLADRGGVIHTVKSYKNCPDLTPRKMKIDISYVNRILGTELKEQEIKKFLERMGFGYESKYALIPAYRTDILHQMDLVEDIAIAYGYENFKEEIPSITTIALEDRREILISKLVRILIGMNLLETSTYHLTNKENLNNRMNADTETVDIENAITKDYSALRSWLLPGLMDVFSRNKHNEYPQRIFEIGKIFTKGKTETGVIETTSLAVACSHSLAGFTEIKQILDGFMRALGVSYEFAQTEHDSMIPGRVGKIIINKKEIGFIGEIHPEVLTAFELEMPVSCLEINLDEIFSVL